MTRVRAFKFGREKSMITTFKQPLPQRIRQFSLSTKLVILNYPVILSHRRSTIVSLEINPLSPLWWVDMSAFRPSRYKALWKALTLGHLFKKLLPIFRSLKTSSRHARWRTKQLLDNLCGSINCVTLEVLTTRERVKASKALLFYVTRSGKTRNSAEHKILAKEIGYLASGFFFLKQCIVDLKNSR